MAKKQTLSFPIRLPDAMQAEAVRLLDASRTAINEILQTLWPDLDAFTTERTGPAWKQVEPLLLKRSGHGSRQERCEMEQAGRILRAQAARKQVFLTILPLLSDGLIRPADEQRPAKKDYRAINEQVRALRADLDDPDTFMALTNMLEQACNHYLRTGTFPATYEEVQSVPVQEVGQLTFAGDDGMILGQTYRMRLLWEHFCELSSIRKEHKHAGLWLKLRAPSANGRWAWGEWSQEIALPETVFEYLALGAVTQAPTLREITSADGSRVAVLDMILEVPASYVSPLEHERRVLGWDWGVRSLITVSVLEMGDGSRPAGRSTHGAIANWRIWPCSICGENLSTASLNIAWLGLAFLTTYHQTKRYVSYCMTDEVPSVKPSFYTREGATLLLPSQRFTPRPSEGKHIYYAGWSFSIALRTSRPKTMMAVLSASRFRKDLLNSA
jgi:putative transposase